MKKPDTTTAVQNVRTHYPQMDPYVGANSGDNPYLLVGESHYLRKDTHADTSSEVWYAGDSVLDEQDRNWIDTAGIIREAVIVSNRHYPEHGIWYYGPLEINKGGPDFNGSVNEILQKVYNRLVAFNFFLRPAKEGKSIKSELEQIDISVANENLIMMIEQFKPKGIIITSSVVGDCVNKKYLKELGIPFVIAPHPSCFWWNRKCSKYGGKYGRELVSNFVNKTGWWDEEDIAHNDDDQR